MKQRRQKRYGIIGVFGDREQGKTTYMVKHLMKELNSGFFYDQGFSNITIDHPKVKKVTYAEMKELKQPAPNGVPRSLLAIDQIQRYIDARKSNSKGNIEFSNIMIESRQHGFDVIYTTWMRSVVDKRLRPFTQLYVLAQRAEKGFEYDLVDRDEGSLGPPRTMPWAMAQEVWKHFDSTELIEDRTIPT